MVCTPHAQQQPARRYTHRGVHCFDIRNGTNPHRKKRLQAVSCTPAKQTRIGGSFRHICRYSKRLTTLGESFAIPTNVGIHGEPGGIRTHDLLIRSQTLYPAELRAHDVRDAEKNEPGGIRTHDLLIRSQTLYPAELRAHSYRSACLLS